jgi:hypothetical protein
MAVYTYVQLYGSGSLSQNLTAATLYHFEFSNPSGSSYFVMETARDNDGFYTSASPNNINGVLSVSSSMNKVTSSYIAGFEIPSGISAFDFTPTNNVTGTTLYLRGTGMFDLTLTP